MRGMISVILLMIIVAMVGCGGGGSGDGHIPMGTLLVTVDDSFDDSAIQDAIVSVYDEKNLIVKRGTTDANGECSYSLSPGGYHVKVAAQGFNKPDFRDVIY